MALSIVGFGSWLVWFYLSFYLLNVFQIFSITPLLSTILFTTLFLHLDKLAKCCCDPREKLSVYDPAQDKRFIMRDGEVVEDPEDDVETETKTCCHNVYCQMDNLITGIIM